MITTTNIPTPAVQAFEFAPGMSLEAVLKDRQTWFLASTVCKALDLANVSQALSALDEDERSSVTIDDVKRGTPRRLVINESGLYSLILRSHKPEAKAFRKWFTSVVLPALRKDGLYIAGEEKEVTAELSLPELLAQLATIQAKVDALKEQKVRAWSALQEEKEARRDALRFLKGRSVPLRCGTAALVRKETTR